VLLYRPVTIPGHHGPRYFSELLIVAYLLPRVVFVAIAWAMTCGLINQLWPEADPLNFGVAAASWACGGFAYFAYLRKLRREIADLQRNRRYRAVGSTI